MTAFDTPPNEKCKMTTLNIVRDEAAASYAESIQTYQSYIDGDDSIGLVETVEIGNGMRALYPLSRSAAKAALIRELRRYANYLEQGPG